MARTNRVLFEALREESLESQCRCPSERQYARRMRSIDLGVGSGVGSDQPRSTKMKLSPVYATGWMHRAGAQCLRSLRLTLGAPSAPSVSSCVQFRAGCGWSVIGAYLELDIVFSDAEMVALDGCTDSVPVESVCASTWRVRLGSPLSTSGELYTQSVTAEFVGVRPQRPRSADQSPRVSFSEELYDDSPNAFDFVVNVYALQPGMGVSERMHLGRAAVLGTELIGRDTRLIRGNRFAFQARRPIVTSPGRVVGEFIFSYVVIEPYRGRHAQEALSAADRLCRQCIGPRALVRAGTAPPGTATRAMNPDLSKRPTTWIHDPLSVDAVPFGSLLIGHRGGGEGGTTPLQENTMLSFLAATRGNSIRAIELDVQLTRDGVPVVHHDAVLHLPSDMDGDGFGWRSRSKTSIPWRISTGSPFARSTSATDADIFGPSAFEADLRTQQRSLDMLPRACEMAANLFSPMRFETMPQDDAEVCTGWKRGHARFRSATIDTDDEESDESAFDTDLSIERYCLANAGYSARRRSTARTSKCCIGRPIFTMDLEEWKQASTRLLRRKQVDARPLPNIIDHGRSFPTDMHRRNRPDQWASFRMNEADAGMSFVSGAESAGPPSEFGISKNRSIPGLDQHSFAEVVHARSLPQESFLDREPPGAGKSSRTLHSCSRCERARSTIRDTMPTLEEVLRQVPPFVHILVEIKYPIPESCPDGTIPAPERNYLVDCVIETVFRVAFAGDADARCSLRSRVSFLSFDPEVCLLLRRKQNICRVLFLCSEDRDGDVVPTDQRRMRAECALRFAHQSGLSGVVFFNEILLAAGPPLIRLAHQVYRLLIMCYGRTNALPECATQLLEWQVDGIITDRVGYVARSLMQRQAAAADLPAFTEPL
jgi:glycerophosphoryl diester phosphodiesterase